MRITFGLRDAHSQDTSLAEYSGAYYAERLGLQTLDQSYFPKTRTHFIVARTSDTTLVVGKSCFSTASMRKDTRRGPRTLG